MSGAGRGSLSSCITEYSTLVRYAYSRTRSLDAAEDLVQDAFLCLYKDLRRGIAIGTPKAWTLTVVKRGILRCGRRPERLHTPLQGDEVSGSLAIEEDVAQNFERDILSCRFSQLPDREEEVLLLRLEGHKYREIADSLGISANSFNTLLSRALRKIRQVVANGRQPQKAGENSYVLEASR